jgi:hypothetical protein
VALFYNPRSDLPLAELVSPDCMPAALYKPITFDEYPLYCTLTALDKVIKKLKYILKLYYVINYIIFNFFYNFNFFNKMNGQNQYKNQRRNTS